jgi:DNA repair ATPase RecN
MLRRMPHQPMLFKSSSRPAVNHASRVNSSCLHNTPQRLFHASRPASAPCQGGPSADEYARQNLEELRKAERDLCELRGLVAMLYKNKPDHPAAAKIIDRHLADHKEHRVHEFNMMVRDAQTTVYDSINKIRNNHERIRVMKLQIAELENEIPQLHKKHQDAVAKLEEMGKVDTDSVEFLNPESTRHFAPKV